MKQSTALNCENAPPSAKAQLPPQKQQGNQYEPPPKPQLPPQKQQGNQNIFWNSSALLPPPNLALNDAFLTFDAHSNTLRDARNAPDIKNQNMALKHKQPPKQPPQYGARGGDNSICDADLIEGSKILHEHINKEDPLKFVKVDWKKLCKKQRKWNAKKQDRMIHAWSQIVSKIKRPSKERKWFYKPNNRRGFCFISGKIKALEVKDHKRPHGDIDTRDERRKRRTTKRRKLNDTSALFISETDDDSSPNEEEDEDTKITVPNDGEHENVSEVTDNDDGNKEEDEVSEVEHEAADDDTLVNEDEHVERYNAVRRQEAADGNNLLSDDEPEAEDGNNLLNEDEHVERYNAVRRQEAADGNNLLSDDEPEAEDGNNLLNDDEHEAANGNNLLNAE
eukprot:947461_1